MKNTNLLIITSYPPQGHIHAQKTVGIASYTKNTLLALTKAMKKHERLDKITVLAEQLKGEKKQMPANLTPEIRQLTIDLTVILSTLAEETESVRETTIYMALDSDMKRWETCKRYLVNGGLMTVEYNQCKLTKAGKELAAKIDKAQSVQK